MFYYSNKSVWFDVWITHTHSFQTHYNVTVERSRAGLNKSDAVTPDLLTQQNFFLFLDDDIIALPKHEEVLLESITVTSNCMSYHKILTMPDTISEQIFSTPNTVSVMLTDVYTEKQHATTRTTATFKQSTMVSLFHLRKSNDNS